MINKKIIIIFILFKILNLKSYSEEDLDETDDKMIINIDKAITLAVANDKELKISKATIKIEDKAFFYELRKFLPALSFGFSNTNQVAINGPDTRSTSLSMGLDLLIFDGGKLIFNTFMNRMNVELGKRELLLKINEIIMKTNNEYYTLILLLEKEKQQGDLLKIGLIQEQHSELEYAAGTISEIDYYDIGLKVKQIEIDVQEAIRERNDTLRDFKYRLGFENTEICVYMDINYDLLSLTNEDIQVLQKIALANRLDISKSYQTILNNKVNYAYSIASFLPNVNLGFIFSLTDEEFPPRRKSWGMNFTIDLPLPYLPLKVSPRIGGVPSNTERKLSDETGVKVGENITYENDIAKAKIKLTTDNIKHLELVREINNQVEKEANDYIDLLKIYKLKILQNTLALKKLNVMRIKLDIGEIRRVELLEEEMNYNKSIIEEKEILFQLIDKETTIKQVLGIMGKEINLRDILQNDEENEVVINNDLKKILKNNGGIK